MRGKTKTPWLPVQLALLERMIEGGSDYATVAALVGHSVMSCRTKISELRKLRCSGEQPKPVKVSRKPHVPPIVLARRPQAPLLPTRTNDVPHTRATSTFKLQLDAELRARIEVQGITAGLLGDPMPGRSALDQRRHSLPPTLPSSHARVPLSREEADSGRVHPRYTTYPQGHT